MSLKSIGKELKTEGNTILDSVEQAEFKKGARKSATVQVSFGYDKEKLNRFNQQLGRVFNSKVVAAILESVTETDILRLNELNFFTTKKQYSKLGIAYVAVRNDTDNRSTLFTDISVVKVPRTPETTQKLKMIKEKSVLSLADTIGVLFEDYLNVMVKMEKERERK